MDRYTAVTWPFGMAKAGGPQPSDDFRNIKRLANVASKMYKFLKFLVPNKATGGNSSNLWINQCDQVECAYSHDLWHFFLRCFAHDEVCPRLV